MAWLFNLEIIRSFTLIYTVLLLLFIPFSLNAQMRCAQIVDDPERLACFDRVENSPPSDNPTGGLVDWNRQAGSDSADFSLLNERWELQQDLPQYAFRPYKPVYFFPVYYSSSQNELPQTSNPRTTTSQPLNLDSVEAKFQLSFKTKLANDLLGSNGDLWLGYTQSSHWQIYNVEESRPFRETNHEPELMFVWRTNYSLFGFQGRLLSLSLNHQSNGQEEPLSRSWNRVILTLGLDRPDWVIQLRPWWRLPEASAEEDENPGIVNTVGRAELLVVHRRKNSHQIAARLRHSLKTGGDSKGSINLDWSYPCFDRLRCYAQVFHGYGESLIDYNHKTSSLGLGVALVEWF